MRVNSDQFARHISASGRGVGGAVFWPCAHTVFLSGLLLAVHCQAEDSHSATNANTSASASVGVVQMANEADLKEPEISKLDFDTVKGPLRVSAPEASFDPNGGRKLVVVGGIEISRAETWMPDDDLMSGPLVVSGSEKLMTVTKSAVAEGKSKEIAKGIPPSKTVAPEVVAAGERARDLTKEVAKPAETAKATAKETTRKPPKESAKEVAKMGHPTVPRETKRAADEPAKEIAKGPVQEVRAPVTRTSAPETPKESVKAPIKEAPKEVVQVAAPAPVEAPKKTAEKPSKEAAKEPVREVATVTKKEPVPEPLKELPKAPAREVPKETVAAPIPEPAREVAKETSREAHHEAVKEPAAEMAKGIPMETAKVAAHEMVKEPAKETPKEMVRDVAPETKKETPKEGFRELTGEPVKEVAKRDEKRRGQGEERSLGPLGLLIDALNGLSPGARESRKTKPENAALSETAVAARPSNPLGTEKVIAEEKTTAGGGEVKIGVASKEANAPPSREIAPAKEPEQPKLMTMATDHRPNPALVPPKPEVKLRESVTGATTGAPEYPLSAEMMPSAGQADPASSSHARPPVLIGALSETSKEPEPKVVRSAARPEEAGIAVKGELPSVTVQLPERPLTVKEMPAPTPSNAKSEGIQLAAVPAEPPARIEVAALNAPAAVANPKTAPSPVKNKPVNVVVGALNNPSSLAATAARSSAVTVAGNIEVALLPGMERRAEKDKPPILVSGVPNVVPLTGGVRVGTLAGTGIRAPAVLQGESVTVRDPSGNEPVAGAGGENFPLVVAAAADPSTVSARSLAPVQVGSLAGGNGGAGGKSGAASVNSRTTVPGGIIVGGSATAMKATVTEPSRAGAPAAYSGNTISVAMASEAVGQATVNPPRNKLFNPAGTLLYVGGQGDEEAKVATGEGRTAASSASAANRPLGGKVGTLTLAEDSMLNLKPAGKRDALSYAPAKRSLVAENENMSTRLLDAEMQLLKMSEATALADGSAASLAADDKSRRDASSPSSGPKTEALLGGLMLLGLLVQQWQRFREENHVRR